MIDRNKDCVYGGYGDLIIDWVGEDEDGNPAMQVVVDNIPEANRMKTGNGHYMWGGGYGQGRRVQLYRLEHVHPPLLDT